MDLEDKDPFDIQCEFLDLLKQNLSSRMIQKICDFAYLHKQCYQELFEAIKSHLVSIHPVKRLSTFHLIDALLKNQQKYRFRGYSELILQSLNELVNNVLGLSEKKEKSGLANISGVRRVLITWKQKEIISQDTFNSLDKFISSHDQKEVSLSKEAIWRRMEEDRERQKRNREESWVRNEHEFEVAWKKAKELGTADYDIFECLDIKYKLSN